jgi:hypothetical protein
LADAPLRIASMRLEQSARWIVRTLSAWFVRLWADDAGSVIAAEYLLLGSIVSLGGVGGLVAMRDSMNDGYREFGESMRELRPATSMQAPRGLLPRAHAESIAEHSPVLAIDVIP